MRHYDHQSKAGNRGDVVKHPALIAVLEGLLAEHEGPFRYADAFAGRWESTLLEGAGWIEGIGILGRRWRGGHPDVDAWRRQWSAEAGARYPGSTQFPRKGHFRDRPCLYGQSWRQARQLALRVATLGPAFGALSSDSHR